MSFTHDLFEFQIPGWCHLLMFPKREYLDQSELFLGEIVHLVI